MTARLPRILSALAARWSSDLSRIRHENTKARNQFLFRIVSARRRCYRRHLTTPWRSHAFQNHPCVLRRNRLSKERAVPGAEFHGAIDVESEGPTLEKCRSRTVDALDDALAAWLGGTAERATSKRDER